MTTIRATATPTATGHRISIPADETAEFPADTVVRVVLDGQERFCRIDRPLTGDGLTIDGVYDTPASARQPGTGEDRLAEWLSTNGIDGGSVLVDVVEEDFQYGLRPPGETTIYTAKEPPSESLSSIAESIDESE